MSAVESSQLFASSDSVIRTELMGGARTGMIRVKPIVLSDTREGQFTRLEDWPQDAPNPLSKLTDSQLDIVGLISLGLNTAEIAKRRFVTDQTVKYHLGLASETLGAQNRAEVGRIARRAGIFTCAAAIDHEGLAHLPLFWATKLAMQEVEFDSASTRPNDAITPQQWQILRQLAEGSSNKAIAEAMDIKVGTVKYHLGILFANLGIYNQDSFSKRNKAATLLDFEEAGLRLKRFPGISLAKKAEATDSTPDQTTPVDHYLVCRAADAASFLDDWLDLSCEEPTHLPISAYWEDINTRFLRNIGAITPYMVRKGWIDLPAAILQTQLMTGSIDKHVIDSGSYYDLSIKAATIAAKKLIAARQSN